MSKILECKRLCLVRCLSALALSACTQFFLLFIYLLFVNFHMLHPINWLTETIGLIFSFYTWLSIIPLISVVVIYGIILGKSLLAVKKFYPSRFKWICGTALRKLGFLFLHIGMGFVTAWLYARFLHTDYRNLILHCFGTYCINSRYTFLLSIGIAAGCYHFVKQNIREEPEVEFPIIQEHKWVKIRSTLYTTLYMSLVKSFVPTLCFTATYWLLGGIINSLFADIFNVEVDNSLISLFAIASNLRLFFYGWILSSQILSNMHLMKPFFSIYLAEEMHFKIENPVLTKSTEVTLTDALSMTQMPIIQNLAALDLYNIGLSKSPAMRQDIFALSLPGGHPHNWHQLADQCLVIINAFTDELSASVKNISAIKSTPLFATIKPTATDAAAKILLRQYNETHGIRRIIPDPCSTTSPMKQPMPSSPSTFERINEQFEQLSRQIEEACRTAFRSIPGLLYLFGESDGAKTAFLLSNSQNIIWVIQGLSGICAVSLVEDKYGVVQVKLPQIIKSMLKLKLELDKLNNVNLNGKKSDRNLITLRSAVKRSLYKICTVFGDYLRELIDDHEDLRNLQFS